MVCGGFLEKTGPTCPHLTADEERERMRSMTNTFDFSLMSVSALYRHTSSSRSSLTETARSALVYESQCISENYSTAKSKVQKGFEGTCTPCSLSCQLQSRWKSWNSQVLFYHYKCFSLQCCQSASKQKQQTTVAGICFQVKRSHPIRSTVVNHCSAWIWPNCTTTQVMQSFSGDYHTDACAQTRWEEEHPPDCSHH